MSNRYTPTFRTVCARTVAAPKASLRALGPAGQGYLHGRLRPFADGEPPTDFAASA
jgi:hypothetical protein